MKKLLEFLMCVLVIMAIMWLGHSLYHANLTQYEKQMFSVLAGVGFAFYIGFRAGRERWF